MQEVCRDGLNAQNLVLFCIRTGPCECGSDQLLIFQRKRVGSGSDGETAQTSVSPEETKKEKKKKKKEKRLKMEEAEPQETDAVQEQVCNWVALVLSAARAAGLDPFPLTSD